MLTFQTKKSDSTNTPFIQTQLKVGKPGDKYELEADAMANRVMAMPQTSPSIQPKCISCQDEEVQMKAWSGSSIQMQPLEEEEEMMQPKLQLQPLEEEEILQTKSIRSNSIDTDSISNQLTNSKNNGAQLPESTNHFMSGAFNSDFSSVKIHTDSKAVQMNQQLDARAFTHGKNIYFNKGEYSPDSSYGKRLLAHELTHVIQQNNTINQIQKLCGEEEIGTRTTCEGLSGEVFGDLFLFNVNCDEFAGGEELRLHEYGNSLGQNTSLVIHGFASEDGPEEYNEQLSCARSEKASQLLTDLGHHVVKLYKHGEVPGNRADRRSVVVQVVHGNVPEPEVEIPEGDVSTPDPETPAQISEISEDTQCQDFESWLGPALSNPPNLITDIVQCVCLGIKVTDLLDDVLARLPVVGTALSRSSVQRAIEISDTICNLYDFAQLAYRLGTEPGPCWSLSNYSGSDIARVVAMAASIPVDLFSSEIAKILTSRLPEASAATGAETGAATVGTTGAAAGSTVAGPPGTAVGGAVGTATGAAGGGILGYIVGLFVREQVRAFVETTLDIGVFVGQNYLLDGSPFPVGACRSCLRVGQTVTTRANPSLCDTINSFIPEGIRIESWDEQNQTNESDQP